MLGDEVRADETLAAGVPTAHSSGRGGAGCGEPCLKGEGVTVQEGPTGADGGSAGELDDTEIGVSGDCTRAGECEVGKGVSGGAV